MRPVWLKSWTGLSLRQIGGFWGVARGPAPGLPLVVTGAGRLASDGRHAVFRLNSGNPALQASRACRPLGRRFANAGCAGLCERRGQRGEVVQVQDRQLVGEWLALDVGRMEHVSLLGVSPLKRGRALVLRIKPAPAACLDPSG